MPQSAAFPAYIQGSDAPGGKFWKSVEAKKEPDNIANSTTLPRGEGVGRLCENSWSFVERFDELLFHRVYLWRLKL